MTEISWGPSGQDVYDRTYSRIKSDGARETWPETVERVVDGNLSLVAPGHIEKGERQKLIDLMTQFKVIPAGRHLWLSGVPGKQFINNCWVSGWTEEMADHFGFTFDQLMQGGGVGANYSGIDYPISSVDVHLVLDDSHKDYEACKPYLSKKYWSQGFGNQSVGDTREDWVGCLREVLDASQHGKKVTLIYDLSNIRESGKKIKTFGGTSAGPVPLAKLLTSVAKILDDSSTDRMSGPMAMEIDHAVAECVVSGNVRRSARMSIMHWKDPNIDWFLTCKSDQMSHWSTNISVEIDQEFIDALDPNTDDYDNEDHARRVYTAITEGMVKNGEPGIWNSELSNADEPGYVEATNPCGEITLPAWGVCNLGHVNLDAFVTGEPDFFGLVEAHRLMARFLVRATFADIPSERARAVQDRDRRIGVGHFGFHGFLAKLGIKFSEAGGHEKVTALLQVLKGEVRAAAANYAYLLRVPEPVKVTTVAPTGTIAKMPGRSEGIHPIFSPYFMRRIRFSTVDPDQAAKLESYRLAGFDVEDDLYSANTAVVSIPTKEPLVGELEELGVDPRVLEGAYELSLSAQLRVQQMYQQHYADNAVSFTVNIDPEMYEAADLAKGLLPFLGTLKGTTVFPVLSRAQAPYEPMTKKQYEAYENGVTDVGIDEECSTGACPVK